MICGCCFIPADVTPATPHFPSPFEMLRRGITCSGSVFLQCAAASIQNSCFLGVRTNPAPVSFPFLFRTCGRPASFRLLALFFMRSIPSITTLSVFFFMCNLIEFCRFLVFLWARRPRAPLIFQALFSMPCIPTPSYFPALVFVCGTIALLIFTLFCLLRQCFNHYLTPIKTAGIIVSCYLFSDGGVWPPFDAQAQIWS